MMRPSLAARLRRHLAANDPWRLAANPFEQVRYSELERLLDCVSGTRLARGMEIGCAAGVFTERLMSRCEHLTVVDALPEAIERCQQRLGPRPDVRYVLADVCGELALEPGFDLVVMTEVVYYLGGRNAVADVIRRVTGLIKPGGALLFSSATNHAVRQWGYECGAETALVELSRDLVVHEQRLCYGSSAAECSILARLSRPTRVGELTPE